MTNDSERVELPPVTEDVKNLDQERIIQIDEYGVFEWHEEKDGQGEPTMVVLMMKIGQLEDIQLGLRFKSAVAVNELIAMLRRHRDGVWPRWDITP